MTADDRDSPPSYEESEEESTTTNRGPKLNLRRIERDCQVLLDARLGKVSANGVFKQSDVREAVHGVLKNLDLNEYRLDIAHRLSNSIVRKRNSAFGQAMQAWSAGQFELFTQDFAMRVWIPLADGGQIALANATWAHWMHKRQQEQQDIDAKIAAMTRNDSNFQQLQSIMEPDPQCTVTQAMRRLGYWGKDAPMAA